MEDPGPPSTPIHESAKRGYVDGVKEALGEKADVNLTDNMGNTPLHYASSGGHTDCVQFLLSNGAKVDALNNNKDTPLHRAAWRNNVDVVKALLAAGADKLKDAKNGEGKTPLELARAVEIRKLIAPTLTDAPDEGFDQEDEDSD